MKIPAGSTTFLDRIAKRLIRIYSSHWLVKFCVIPAIIGIPPALITAFYSNDYLRDIILKAAPPLVSKISTDYGWLFIAFSGFYPIFLFIVGKEIFKRGETNGLNVDGLLALINSLDQIVGYKNNRFTKQTMNAVGLTKEDAFCQITQPATQIEEIVRSICGFFNATQTEKKKSLIRVTLAEIQDGKIASIPLAFPSDEAPKASVAGLNNPKSAISIAVKTQDMVLIEDIAKELQKPKTKRRYVDTGNDEDNSGSIICYPVYHAGNIAYPYVISVHSNEPRYFRNEFKQLYEHSLQRFALRLSVEHSLFILKETLCGQ